MRDSLPRPGKWAISCTITVIMQIAGLTFHAGWTQWVAANRRCSQLPKASQDFSSVKLLLGFHLGMPWSVGSSRSFKTLFKLRPHRRHRSRVKTWAPLQRHPSCGMFWCETSLVMLVFLVAFCYFLREGVFKTKSTELRYHLETHRIKRISFGVHFE